MTATSQSPSLADGFRGARDAAILQTADLELSDMTAHVQCVARTRDLLKRAGIKRPKTHEFYPVAVEWDARFSRYQLAPVNA